MLINQCKQIFKRHITIFENFTYITALQLFVMFTPLITYPYLIRILGSELYGWVITAQVVASYCSIFIDFGFKSVSARHVAKFRDNREKLSEIISSILFVQVVLWFIALIGYVLLIYLVSSFRQHLYLFLFSFALTFNELLFPQYYFQGIEKMKYIALLNVVIRSIFVILTFVLIRSADDYIFVPLLSAIGYVIGGVWALYIIFIEDKIHFQIPSFRMAMYYFKDASPIFFTDVICTIKDKLNYLLLGTFVGVGQVVIYDLGSRLSNILTKPTTIISTVLFPKIAKERNVYLFKKVVVFIALGSIFLVGILNLFLPSIVHFFLNESVDLLPIRIYSLVPIILGVGSYIASNLIVALGYNKYMLYSIIITTIIYLSLLGTFYWLGYLDSVTSFVVLTLLSYLGELLYRLMVSCKIFRLESKTLKQ